MIWGLWFISYTLGRYPAAREAGQKLLEEAQRGDDSGRLLEAHHAAWPTLLAMGETAAAVPHMERGIAIYKKEEHASQAFLYAGHDPGACCRYQQALVQWLLGYPERADALIRDAQHLSDQLRHPLTETSTLWSSAWLHYQRGEREAAARTSLRMRELAETHGFVHWLDASIVVPHVAASRGLDAKALGEMHRELMRVRSAVWRRVFCLCVLATLALESGHPDEGRRALASIEGAGREGFLAPEIMRLEGELHLRSGSPDIGAAEQWFVAAIDLARRQQEKSLELRAATSLARLHRQQNRADDARRALADVYGWFTEGFATADLVAAKELLTR